MVLLETEWSDSSYEYNLTVRRTLLPLCNITTAYLGLELDTTN